MSLQQKSEININEAQMRGVNIISSEGVRNMGFLGIFEDISGFLGIFRVFY